MVPFFRHSMQMQTQVTGMTLDANPNAAQIEFWNGLAGEKWSLYQALLDAAFAPLTQALIEAAHLSGDETIYEIGCGCGDLSLALAAKLRAQGKVIALDISKPMLARAVERTQEAGATEAQKLQFIAADAMTYRFEPLADLVTSRFGVMFFADPLAAFKNIRLGLKPQGRLAILCWCPLEENPWVKQLYDSVIDLAPPLPADLAAKCAMPSPDVPGPYAFSDPKLVCDLLTKAGFTHVRATRVAELLPLGEAPAQAEDPIQAAVEAALPLVVNTGPVAALMREADAQLRAEIKARLRSTLATCVSAGKIELGGACWLYEADNAKQA
ncbi:class I SAM-dependent methyltransferase [Beijerinckia indica]|uniref:Methyltransferase type 12 n=1 Tax=Beijerinckia indica subsp. indica (strain ATCC 9039 / DSM 1715 / NCIMB 8712) TaxID=395963 RepID=B2IEZ4_BEII9|nr:class I SAM-dependent methyltransferase [Beijerinckia indica]ACB94185.1 Methyltransferase type 12 [Beijerinckia indica subsp. indica ATCC 9039]